MGGVLAAHRGELEPNHRDQIHLRDLFLHDQAAMDDTQSKALPSLRPPLSLLPREEEAQGPHAHREHHQVHRVLRRRPLPVAQNQLLGEEPLRAAAGRPAAHALLPVDQRKDQPRQSLNQRAVQPAQEQVQANQQLQLRSGTIHHRTTGQPLQQDLLLLIE